jgi:hypothetical protein
MNRARYLAVMLHLEALTIEKQVLGFLGFAWDKFGPECAKGLN